MRARDCSTWGKNSVIRFFCACFSAEILPLVILHRGGRLTSKFLLQVYKALYRINRIFTGLTPFLENPVHPVKILLIL